MQKVYSRINWENDPSTNTPLSEDNLNKMDYALDIVDSRVVSLYGYQDRIEQSEKNAKTSEENAKVSETNAKQSELKSKEYMESAFKGTPEGYQEVVEKVDSMEIKTTKENTIKGTKNGGFRLTNVKANTTQNGTPSPSTPIPMLSTGDCVETVTSNVVCAKYNIPCKAGDIIGIKTDIICDHYITFYNNSWYVNYSSLKNVKESEFTIPSGITHFNFELNPSVNKITITINGKYLGCVRTKDENGNETVAYFLTDYPMIKGSTLFRENGLVKVKHEYSSYSFSGNEMCEVTNINDYTVFFFRDLLPNASSTMLGRCTHFIYDNDISVDNKIYAESVYGYVYLRSTMFSTIDEVKSYLATQQSNGTPVTVNYMTKTPIIETLDPQSQIALNGLETFEGVTYVEFDTRVQPLEFEAEVGTSQVGAYTLQAMNVAESNAVRINELAVAMVSL